ncbi:MAG: hypothetical protein QM723_28570 [Myxococcaceae bacterium]
MRQQSLTLPVSCAPRAPSTALLSVFWAALALLAAWGVVQAKHGHDLTPALGLTVLGPSETFDAQYQHTNADGVKVQFGAAHPEDDSVSHRGAVKVGDHFLDLPGDFEGGDFVELLVSPDERHWLAVEAFDTEAMGDLQLVASDDGGRTFVHRGTLDWPTYVASLDSVRLDGDTVTVELSLDEESQLSEPWWHPWDGMWARFFGRYPTLKPGHYVVRSTNGGRSFGRLRSL